MAEKDERTSAGNLEWKLVEAAWFPLFIESSCLDIKLRAIQDLVHPVVLGSDFTNLRTFNYPKKVMTLFDTLLKY